MKMSSPRLERQEPFLTSLFQAASRPQQRARLLQHANSDQINAVSELVLNTLKNNVPLTPPMMARLRRYKGPLREIGKRQNSVKKRRQHLLAQHGRGFWTSLREVCHCVLPL